MSNSQEITENKLAQGVPATSPVSLQQVSLLMLPAKGRNGEGLSRQPLLKQQVIITILIFFSNTITQKGKSCSPEKKKKTT